MDKLREFLQDPMNDDHVRQDEKEKKPTIEHIKLLRKRLAMTIVKELRTKRGVQGRTEGVAH